MRKELKEPKNLIGVILTLISFLLAMWAIVFDKSDTYFFIAVGLYIVGMILIVIKNKKPEH